ncbi:MAG: hypothetical protein IKE21_02680 [Erysipelotrichaceae bacterium]|nr:hypothetical protein [Erysipelotrichaceae bacterium]
MEIWGETMEYCFSRLKDRVLEAVEDTDLNSLFVGLLGIRGNTLVTGVGGSSVVSCYVAKVLSAKNHILAEHRYPRDLLYGSLSYWQNVVSCSYSGGNIGVDASFYNGLQKYLFSANTREGARPLQYKVRDEELSFVSFAGTLIPMALAFLYYTNNDQKLLKEILETEYIFPQVPQTKVVEVLGGRENSVAMRFLDSTLCEGALAAPVLHETYNYAHGCCQLNDRFHNDLIYFTADNEYDRLLQSELPGFYERVAQFSPLYNDEVINEFASVHRMMHLCKAMAEAQGRDLSKKVVPEISETLYTYRGLL